LLIVEYVKQYQVSICDVLACNTTCVYPPHE